MITKGKTLTLNQTIREFGKIQITELLLYSSTVFISTSEHFLLTFELRVYIYVFPKLSNQKHIKFDLLIPFPSGNHCL